MREIRKIIICTDYLKDKSNFISKAEEYNTEIYFLNKNGQKLMNLIELISPYIVCTDLFLRNLDLLTIISELRKKTKKLPAFIITSNYKDKYIESKFNEYNVKYSMISVDSCEDICEYILGVLHQSTSDMIIFDNNKDLFMKISDALHHLGVPAHLKGYEYLRYCILFSILDDKLNVGMTKKLYIMVAEIYNSKYSQVERCIRHAIQTAWERHDEVAYMDFFIRKMSRKPSNTEFITVVTSKLKNKNN